MSQTLDLLRRRFWELDAQREAILSVSGPLRENRDANADDLTPKQRREIDAQIKEAEAGLYEIDVERGQITKALRDHDGITRLGPRPQ